MRLRWRGPGLAEAVVPADHLAHGDDRQPGLAAAVWTKTRNFFIEPQPSAEDLAWLAQHPWLHEARNRCAIALSRNGRWAEAAPLFDDYRCSGHSLYFPVTHYRVRGLLELGRDAEAVERFVAAGASQYSCCGGNWQEADADALALQFIDRGLTAQALKAVKPNDTPGLGERRLRCLLDLVTGDWKRALADRDVLITDRARHDQFDDFETFVRLHLERQALCRLLGRPEPDHDAFLDALERMGTLRSPATRLAIQYMSGEIPWPAVAERVAEAAPDLALVRYARAWQLFAEGDHAGAMGLFRALGSAPERDAVAVLSKGMAAWFDGLDEARRRALPKGRPIAPRTPGGTAVQGADRF